MISKALSVYVCFLATAACVSAFVVRPSSQQQRHRRTALHADVAPSSDLSPLNPLKGYLPVDMNRAEYCAKHFGECPVEEIETLFEALHKKRLQEFAFGGVSVTNMATKTPEQMESFILEEELELQFNLLGDITPNPNLFPDVEDEMQELPHLKDQTHSHRIEDAVHKAEHALVMQETVLEESNLETIAICGIILAMAVGS
eukprot:CAMPEP_0198137300 /NCGR_PEP_ID=MMETSP1443-20131203/827_1 /TAXON_ID=186043 /ORGANISM="Entomoneis sp., Strain CCMP2396" /LENGTH=200 /DNA_ID=CAMNT_0043798691 /DNA_START=65 /DNA_END=664 /DNA_ORIENTATION=-